MKIRPPEAELLAALRIPHEIARDRLAAGLERVEHGALARLALREGVSCLLHRDIERNGLRNDIDASAADVLRQRYVDTAAANLRRAAALRQILRHPEIRGKKVVVLKGMAILDEVYGDWGLRPMTDMDLWLSEADAPALRQALVALGYRVEPFYPDTFRLGCVTVEIHTSLLGSERIKGRDRILADGPTKPFDRAQRFVVAETESWRLDRQDAALFACLHLLKHNASRLLWLLEIDAMMTTWDSDDLATFSQRARAAGQWQTVGLIAHLAADLLVPASSERHAVSAELQARRHADGGRRPGGVPSARSTGLGRLTNTPRPSASSRRALSRRRTRGSLPVWAPLVFFNGGDRRLGRVLSAFETLFPRPPTIRQIFRDQESWLPTLYVRRLLRLVEMVIRS